MDRASPTHIYEAGMTEQMLLLSCNSTRKHQFQCSGGGGRQDNYSVPLPQVAWPYGPANTPLSEQANLEATCNYQETAGIT